MSARSTTGAMTGGWLLVRDQPGDHFVVARFAAGDDLGLGVTRLD
ncbi:MAG: hypothetical protein ACLPUG_17805 [Acidimicrobiales bacterium]